MTFVRTAVVVALALATLAGCGAVTFSSHARQRIAGVLRKAAGNGPFPAVILMHGCGGVQSGNELWATDLTKWGYVTLLVDSFGPRGLSEICTNFSRLSVFERTLDAYGALDYLQSLPVVDRNRIASWVGRTAAGGVGLHVGAQAPHRGWLSRRRGAVSLL